MTASTACVERRLAEHARLVFHKLWVLATWIKRADACIPPRLAAPLLGCRHWAMQGQVAVRALPHVHVDTQHLLLKTTLSE